MILNFEKTDEYLKHLKRFGKPDSLVCFERGYHDVEPMVIKKPLKFDWFICSCGQITFKKKNTEPNNVLHV